VLGIGSSPGKTNLMAALAVRELDLRGDRALSIEVCAAGRDPAAIPGAFSPPYAVQTLVDELTLAPVVLCGGEPVEVEPLRDGGEVDFGEPIGRGATMYTLHSELATFGQSFGCAEASFRLSLAPALLARLRELAGAGDPAAIAAAARSAVAPSGETVSVHLIVARGERESISVRALTRPALGLGGSIVSTGAPAAAAVRLLARGQIAATGALPPERCLDPELMFAELESRGCTVTVSRE
jgi:saccharopine dehydrogenase-like NADP-dependent oxidoreductase